MKTIIKFLEFFYIFLSFNIMFSGCSQNKINSKIHYLKCDLVIIGSNEGTGISNDKYHKPLIIKIWLLKNLQDTTKFLELSSQYQNPIRISDSMWYNHNLYDTLHFDYIRKDRFFTINKIKWK